MRDKGTHKASRSRALVAAAFLGVAVFGASLAQAQEPLSPAESDAAPQSGASMKGIEESDIRRGHTRHADVDGDGLGDAAAVARQADLKKLADELVKSQEPAAYTGGSGDQPAATNVGGGNALDGGAMNERAGDAIPGVDITVNQGAPLSQARPGRADEGAGEPEAGAERKKMKRLEPTYTEPLELLDETDPCPTLPCP